MNHLMTKADITQAQCITQNYPTTFCSEKEEAYSWHAEELSQLRHQRA